eukprot:tig00000984_g5979.t1
MALNVNVNGDQASLAKVDGKLDLLAHLIQKRVEPVAPVRPQASRNSAPSRSTAPHGAPGDVRQPLTGRPTPRVSSYGSLTARGTAESSRRAGSNGAAAGGAGAGLRSGSFPELETEEREGPPGLVEASPHSSSSAGSSSSADRDPEAPGTAADPGAATPPARGRASGGARGRPRPSPSPSPAAGGEPGERPAASRSPPLSTSPLPESALRGAIGVLRQGRRGSLPAAPPLPPATAAGPASAGDRDRDFLKDFADIRDKMCRAQRWAHDDRRVLKSGEFDLDTLDKGEIKARPSAPPSDAIARGRGPDGAGGGGAQYYRFDVPPGTNRLLVRLKALSGDPDLYASFLYDFPSPERHTFKSANEGDDALELTDQDPEFKAAPLYIAVHGAVKSEYRLACLAASSVVLTPSKAAAGVCEPHLPAYFRVNLPDARMSICVRLTLESGEELQEEYKPRLYASTERKFPDARRRTWELRFPEDEPEALLVIDPIDLRFRAGWVYLAVDGPLTASVKFSINAYQRKYPHDPRGEARLDRSAMLAMTRAVNSGLYSRAGTAAASARPTSSASLALALGIDEAGSEAGSATTRASGSRPAVPRSLSSITPRGPSLNAPAGAVGGVGGGRAASGFATLSMGAIARSSLPPIESPAPGPGDDDEEEAPPAAARAQAPPRSFSNISAPAAASPVGAGGGSGSGGSPLAMAAPSLRVEAVEAEPGRWGGGSLRGGRAFRSGSFSASTSPYGGATPQRPSPSISPVEPASPSAGQATPSPRASAATLRPPPRLLGRALPHPAPPPGAPARRAAARPRRRPARAGRR